MITGSSGSTQGLIRVSTPASQAQKKVINGNSVRISLSIGPETAAKFTEAAGHRFLRAANEIFSWVAAGPSGGL
jgi:hypothetical protein